MEFIIHCKCLLYVHYTVYPIYMNTMEKFLYCRFDNYLKFNAADYIREGYQCTKVFFCIFSSCQSLAFTHSSKRNVRLFSIKISLLKVKDIFGIKII